MERAECERWERKRQLLLRDAQTAAAQALVHKAGIERHLLLHDAARRRFAHAKQKALSIPLSGPLRLDLHGAQQAAKQAQQEAGLIKEQNVALARERTLHEGILHAYRQHSRCLDRISERIGEARGELRFSANASQAQEIEALAIARQVAGGRRVRESEDGSNDADRSGEETVSFSHDGVVTASGATGASLSTGERGEPGAHCGASHQSPPDTERQTAGPAMRPDYTGLVIKISEQIDQLYSWQAEGGGGLELAYVSSSGRSLSLRVGRRKDGCITVELGGLTHQDRLYLARELPSIEAALIGAGHRNVRVNVKPRSENERA